MAPNTTAPVLPAEVGKGDWTVILLALMVFFAPALGVPHEEMLQDTLKSIVVSFLVLASALLLFWRQRNRREAFRWHAVMWLPLMLSIYALASMAWSHTYLAGVEAIRWFVLSILLWLTLNTASRDRYSTLAWGIHWGAVCVALWGALQFWFDMRYIPQGPNPASTFVNRNFAAEFLACTIPFSFYLLLRSKATATLVVMSVSFAFNLVFMLMCGTRGALMGAAAGLMTMLLVAWFYREKFEFRQWSSGQRILAAGLFLATLLGLGLIKSGNPAAELNGLNAWQRGLGRAASISTGDGSLNIRFIMWKATGRMIESNPLKGVGAGAWEVEIPLYQAEGAQLETDYYVHNEVLQLLAEYGLTGWIFLVVLFGYLLLSAWRSVRNRSAEGLNEAPLRAVALTSLLAFLIVSNVGFPWRLASTGAVFTICLGLLAASDARLGYRGWWGANRLPWSPAASQFAAIATIICLALAAYITQQAAECESKIVKAVKIALTISQSGQPNSPKWDKPKAEMLQLAREGVAINPHYRKITPMVADELAKWGDWKNATWIWESVVGSRPYVVAIMTNIARGYAQMGNNEKALEYLQRSKKLQPHATSVISLEVILLSRTGKEAQALKLAREAMEAKVADFDLISAAYVLATRAGDWSLAVDSLQARVKGWPDHAADSYLKLGTIYSTSPLKNEAKALDAFRAALAAVGDKDKAAIRQQIPAAYQARL